jgi:heat shock protein HtpX
MQDSSSFRALERTNRRRAALLIGAQILLLALFGLGFDLIFGTVIFAGGRFWGFPWFAVAAMLFATAQSMRACFSGTGMILASIGAYPIFLGEPKNRALIDVVNEMAVAARLPVPRIYMIDDPAPNSLAIGRNLNDSVICVTRGLVDQMDREELQGVIGHEMAHIRSFDTRLTTLIATMRLSGIRSLTTLLFGTLTSGIGVMLSRERQYLADAAAVELTRNPAALIRALQLIAKTGAPLKHASPAVEPLFIVDPIGSSKGRGRRGDEFSDLFEFLQPQSGDSAAGEGDTQDGFFASDEYVHNSTHQLVSTYPSLAKRIARLQSLVVTNSGPDAASKSDRVDGLSEGVQ